MTLFELFNQKILLSCICNVYKIVDSFLLFNLETCPSKLVFLKVLWKLLFISIVIQVALTLNVIQ